jgi:hypothetical protein
MWRQSATAWRQLAATAGDDSGGGDSFCSGRGGTVSASVVAIVSVQVSTQPVTQISADDKAQLKQKQRQ